MKNRKFVGPAPAQFLPAQFLQAQFLGVDRRDGFLRSALGECLKRDRQGGPQESEILNMRWPIHFCECLSVSREKSRQLEEQNVGRTWTRRHTTTHDDTRQRKHVHAGAHADKHAKTVMHKTMSIRAATGPEGDIGSVVVRKEKNGSHRFFAIFGRVF